MEMRGFLHTAAAAALLAGCGGAEPPRPPTGADHDAMLAALDQSYIWTCTLTGDGTAAPWRFALQRQQGRRRNVLLLEAGRPPSRPLEVKSEGAARIYTLRDETEIIVASDGEVFASGPGGSRGKTYRTGRCEKGGQPA